MNDARKVGLLGGALALALFGVAAPGVDAQEVPTVEGITAEVNAAIGAGGISVGGDGGGTFATGGSDGGGTVSTGDIAGGGDTQIGGDEGLAVADASGGDSNDSFNDGDDDDDD